MVGKMSRFRPKDVHLIADYQARGLEFDFDPRLTLHLENLTIELFGMSGHAHAYAAVHMKEDQVLLTRENIFHGVMTWYLEALPYEWPETPDFFKQMDAEVVLPGHGIPGGPEWQIHPAPPSRPINPVFR